MPLYHSISDLEFTGLIRLGDHKAFSELYDRYKVVLYIHAKRILNDEEESKDVIQELFINIWLKKSELIINTTVKSYLYFAIRNNVFNKLTRRKLEISYLNSLEETIANGETSLEENLREKELIDVIDREIMLLPLKMRNVFKLSRTHNLSHKEIAEKLNISDKTVKKQIGNAIKILRLKIKYFLFVLPI